MLTLPSSWLPNASMDRVITHWTASPGGYAPTSRSKSHYHFLIDGQGKVHRGSHSVQDNENVNDGNYAAHTKGANTKAIGVAVCCMHGARQSPFYGGRYPMKESQWLKMAQVVAELCAAYAIPVTDTTVLGHGEVQVKLGKPQNGKWDPMVLPWRRSLSIPIVGDLFRSQVTQRLPLVHALRTVQALF